MKNVPFSELTDENYLVAYEIFYIDGAPVCMADWIFETKEEEKVREIISENEEWYFDGKGEYEVKVIPLEEVDPDQYAMFFNFLAEASDLQDHFDSHKKKD